MDDKFHKMAREALLKSSVILPGQVEAVVQALSDLQRETAEACASYAEKTICVGRVNEGKNVFGERQRKASAGKIRERFGLKD